MRGAVPMPIHPFARRGVWGNGGSWQPPQNSETAESECVVKNNHLNEWASITPALYHNYLTDHLPYPTDPTATDTQQHAPAPQHKSMKASITIPGRTPR